jgi:hypothetical protein
MWWLRLKLQAFFWGEEERVFRFYTWDRAFLVEMVFVGITADQI